MSDVVSWGELFAKRIAPGASDSRLRGYLKAIVAPTWNYQQQLLHDKSATRLDAELGLQAVSHLLSVFTAALLRMNQPDSRCENCEANALVAGRCRRCGWEDPNFEPRMQPIRTEEEIAKALEDPCIPSSDISTLINVDEIG